MFVLLRISLQLLDQGAGKWACKVILVAVFNIHGDRSADEHEVWLKGDSLTFVADSAESAEKQAIDFLGAKERKAAW
jgi:hypothetical protein